VPREERKEKEKEKEKEGKKRGNYPTTGRAHSREEDTTTHSRRER
jgi:hypothetical protein